MSEEREDDVGQIATALGTLSIENERQEVKTNPTTGRRRVPLQKTDLRKTLRSATILNIVYWIGKQHGQGFTRSEDLKDLFELVGIDTTKHDRSAALSRWKCQVGEKCLVFAEGRRLSLIGHTRAPKPDILLAEYNPGTRTARREKISKKIRVARMKAP